MRDAIGSPAFPSDREEGVKRAMQDSVRIELFGGLTVLDGPNLVTGFPTYRARSLLAYLAYHREQAHPRELLAEMLWPGGHPDTIRLRLNQTVAEIRRTLKATDDILISDRFTLRLSPQVVTDTSEFLSGVQSARRAADPAQKQLLLTGAVSAVKADFLPGHYEDWTLTARENLAETLQSALQDLARLNADAYDWAEAIRWSRKAVSVSPLSEEAYATLLRILLQAGRTAEALQRYGELRSLLAEQFAVLPSREIQEMMRGLNIAASSPQKPPQPTAKLLPTLIPGERAGKAFSEPSATDTLQHALHVYVSNGDAERGMRLAAALVPYWNLQGELQQGYTWIKRLLALPAAAHAPADSRALALWALGSTATYRGDFEEARTAFQHSLALARSHGERRIMAHSLCGLGAVALRRRKYSEASALFVEARQCYQGLADRSGLAEAWTGIGEAARFQKEYPLAEEAHRKAWALRQELGRQDRAAQSVLNLGIVAGRRGDYAQAGALLHDALLELRYSGSPSLLAEGMMEVAGILIAIGDPHRAACLLSASMRLRQATATPLSFADLPEYVRFLKSIRDALSRDAFAAEWERGRNLLLAEALNLALESRS